MGKVTVITLLMCFLILPAFALRVEWVKVKDEGLMQYIDLEPLVLSKGIVRFKVTLNPLFVKEYELYTVGLVSKSITTEDWLKVNADKVLIPITTTLSKDDVMIMDKTLDLFLFNRILKLSIKIKIGQINIFQNHMIFG